MRMQGFTQDRLALLLVDNVAGQPRRSVPVCAEVLLAESAEFGQGQPVPRTRALEVLEHKNSDLAAATREAIEKRVDAEWLVQDPMHAESVAAFVYKRLQRARLIERPFDAERATPLDVLASDHAGFVSFDLMRLKLRESVPIAAIMEHGMSRRLRPLVTLFLWLVLLQVCMVQPQAIAQEGKLQAALFHGDAKLEGALLRDSEHIVPGAVGPHVLKIQIALLALGYHSITNDELDQNRYGPSTAAAVLAYKQKRSIINRSYQTQADNVVGKMTMASLDRELAAQDHCAAAHSVARANKLVGAIQSSGCGANVPTIGTQGQADGATHAQACTAAKTDCEESLKCSASDKKEIDRGCTCWKGGTVPGGYTCVAACRCKAGPPPVSSLRP